MDHLPLNRILYLGRNERVADTLRSIVTPYFVSKSIPLQTESREMWHVVTNQKAALRSINGSPPQLFLVETTEQPSSRRYLCETVRLRFPGMSIVAVSAHRTPYQFAFDAVIQTPIERTQVVNALNSLATGYAEQTLTCGVFRLFLPTRTLTTPLGERTLTPKQCALLKLFMSRPNIVIKRADIMHTIWDTSYLEDTRTLDVHVRWLREIIEPDPSSPVYLLTQRGIGYQFVIPSG